VHFYFKLMKLICGGLSGKVAGLLQPRTVPLQGVDVKSEDKEKYSLIQNFSSVQF